MAGAIGDEGYLLFVLPAVFPGAEFVEEAAERADDADVGPLAVSPYVVGLARPRTSLFKDGEQGAAVILHVEPVPDVHAVAVDGKGLPLQRTVENEGDKLFGELARSVVVGAVRGDGGQAVGVVIGPHQVVGRGLGRRVG